MIRITVLFTLTIALSLAAPAVANGNLADGDTFKGNGSFSELHLKPKAKWHLLGHSLAIPAYFLLQTTIHESSHALAAVGAGTTVTDFRPYPHMSRGNFVFGEMATKDRLSDTGEGLLLAAPLMTDMVMFTASDLLLTYAMNDDSAAAPFLLMGGMIVPLVDFLVNVNGPSNYNDTSRWTKMAGLPRWSTALMGDALAAVAVWRVLHQGYRIFFEHETSTASYNQSGLSMSPLLIGDSPGLSFSGSF